MQSQLSIHFISPFFEISKDTEDRITQSHAWAKIVPTFGIKPTEDAERGAFISDEIVSVNTLRAVEKELQTQIKELQTQINEEKRKREETEMVLAKHMAELKNLTKENSRLADAYSIIHSCVICLDNARQTRFTGCGHVVCCQECSQAIMNKQPQRLCPVCRSPIPNLESL